MVISYKIGDRFGKLLVTGTIEKTIGKKGRKIRYLVCNCDCGGKAITTITQLRSGHTVGCGCYRREVNLTHNLSSSSEYNIWRGIKSRCFNRKDPRYKDYGGREISVCNRWKSFENFYQDMGKRPIKKTLDRIDNSKGYSKENCKWSTSTEQQNNMRSNHYLEYNNEIKTVTQWEKYLNINKGTLASRIFRGWSTKRAIEKGA